MNKKAKKLKEKIIQQTLERFHCNTATVEIKRENSFTKRVKGVVLTYGDEKRQLIYYNNNNCSIQMDSRLSIGKTTYLCESKLDDFIWKLHFINDFVTFVEMISNNNLITIKELRESRGLTQKQLAEELGASMRAVQQWENHGVNSAMAQKLISLYFNVPEKSIMFETRKDCGFKNKFIFGENKEKYVLNHLDSWMPFFDKVLILSDKKTFNILSKKENINIIKPSGLRMNPVEKAKKIVENNNKNTLVIVSLEEYYHLEDSFYKEFFSKNNKIVLLNEFESEINFKERNYETINTNERIKSSILLGESGTGKTKFIAEHLKEWSKDFPKCYVMSNKGYGVWYQKFKKGYKNIQVLPIVKKEELKKAEKQLSNSKNNLIIIDELDSEEMYLKGEDECNQENNKKEWNNFLKKIYQNNTVLFVVHPSFFEDNLKQFKYIQIINFN